MSDALLKYLQKIDDRLTRIEARLDKTDSLDNKSQLMDVCLIYIIFICFLNGYLNYINLTGYQ